MNPQTVKLIDVSGKIVATAAIADEGPHFGGTINLRATPAALRTLFDEFEETVNGQVFSCLDEVQKKIDAAAISAVFENGEQARIKDLQVYPSSGDVSFKLAKPASPQPSLNGAPAATRQ